jgi:hypothetical protein
LRNHSSRPFVPPHRSFNNNPTGGATDLRDTLAVLATEENSPCDAAGVLALQEEGLGLSVLETEDLGVTADEELTL